MGNPRKQVEEWYDKLASEQRDQLYQETINKARKGSLKMEYIAYDKTLDRVVVAMPGALYSAINDVGGILDGSTTKVGETINLSSFVHWLNLWFKEHK